MEIGDDVELKVNKGPCNAGSRGVVKHKDDNGNVVVEITHDENGAPFTFLLPPSPENEFEVL